MTFGLVLLLIIAITAYSSYKGFEDLEHRSKYAFDVDKVLVFKQYYRLITCTFLHLNWMHLIFNMLALFLFTPQLSMDVGVGGFLLIYFASAALGSLLSLYIHRFNSAYSSIGASGAVSGVVFGCIVLNPTQGVGLLFIPFLSIPGWILGIAYIAYSLYSIKAQRGRVSHEAHMGGAIGGLLLTLLINLDRLPEVWWAALLFLAPLVAFLVLIIKRPDFMFVDNFFQKEVTKIRKNRDGAIEMSRSQELDQLLDKVNKVGYEKLSKAEKARLHELSQR